MATTATESNGNFTIDRIVPGSGSTLKQINTGDFTDVNDTDGTDNGTDLNTIDVNLSGGDTTGLEFVDKMGSEAPSVSPSGAYS